MLSTVFDIYMHIREHNLRQIQSAFHASSPISIITVDLFELHNRLGRIFENILQNYFRPIFLAMITFSTQMSLSFIMYVKIYFRKLIPI
jgi:hypothetical protein